MTRMHVAQRIVADPTSVALMLNASSVPMLAGSDPVAADGEIRFPAGDLELVVARPARTPTSYASGVTVTRDGRRVAWGRLSIGYDDERTTPAGSVLSASADSEPEVADAVRGSFADFLARLAVVVERRTQAA